MGRRGRGPQDRGIEGSLVERTWARRARSGIRVRKTQEPGQALPGLWGALRKLWPRRRRVPRFKALPASGRGRGAPLRRFTFCHKGGVICISEIIDIFPGNLDSSLSFLQPGVSHDVLCI